GVALRDERPLRAGGEARAPAAAHAGLFAGADDRVGLDGQGLLHRLVAVVAVIGLQSPRLGVVPVAADLRGQRCGLGGGGSHYCSSPALFDVGGASMPSSFATFRPASVAAPAPP